MQFLRVAVELSLVARQLHDRGHNIDWVRAKATMFVFWHDVVVNRSVKHDQVVVSVWLPLSTITIAQLVTDRYAMVTLHAFGYVENLEP